MPLPSPKPSFDYGKTYALELQGMASLPFLASRKYSEQQWRALRDGAEPDLLRFESLFVKKMAKLGVPMFCVEMVRTPQRQTELYVKGFSKLQGKAGLHTQGRAFDLIHSVHGWALTPRQWQLVGHVGFEVAKSAGIKVTWGGDDPGVDDKFSWDPAHWELVPKPKAK